MRILQLLSIGLATMVTVATLYIWYDRWKDTNTEIREAFASPSMTAAEMLTSEKKTVPSDSEAVEAHRLLLQYISGNLPKGLQFVKDFGTRFYGDNLPLRQGLDTRNLLDNYRSPIQ
jgi:hypothetical protein